MTTLKLVLTGEPGCGKTTVIRRVVDALSGRIPMTGFVTEEVQDGGRRVGFRLKTLDGRASLLAHRDSRSTLRLGPYGVELEGLESIGLDALTPRSDTRLVVLDEVGKMESFSAAFRDRVVALLDGEVPLLATVALHGVGFVKRIRHDRRVNLVRMRSRAREGMVQEILRVLRRSGVIPDEVASPPSGNRSSD